MKVAIPVAGEGAQVSIRAQHLLGLVPVPHLVAIGEVAAGAVLGVLLDFSDLLGLKCHLDEAGLQVAVDGVLLDPLVDDVVAPPAEIPQDVIGARSVLLDDLLVPVHAVDELPAVAP